MSTMPDIDETAILDEIIRDLRDRSASKDLDFDERMKLNDRLMKALVLRRKERSKKGRGFDLGQGQ